MWRSIGAVLFVSLAFVGQAFADEPPTYVVQPGDSAWAITERLTGNGAGYEEFCELNRPTIEAESIRRGLASSDNCRLIFPGMNTMRPESWAQTAPNDGVVQKTPQQDNGALASILGVPDITWDGLALTMGFGALLLLAYLAANGTPGRYSFAGIPSGAPSASTGTPPSPTSAPAAGATPSPSMPIDPDLAAYSGAFVPRESQNLWRKPLLQGQIPMQRDYSIRIPIVVV